MAEETIQIGVSLIIDKENNIVAVNDEQEDFHDYVDCDTKEIQHLVINIKK